MVLLAYFLFAVASSFALLQHPLTLHHCTVVVQGHKTPFPVLINTVVPPYQSNGQIDLADLCIDEAVYGGEMHVCDHDMAPGVMVAPNFSIAEVVRLGDTYGPAEIKGTVYCSYGVKKNHHGEFEHLPHLNHLHPVFKRL